MSSPPPPRGSFTLDAPAGFEQFAAEAGEPAQTLTLPPPAGLPPGLGGRSRQLGSDSERARLNVTRAIRTAISRIRDRALDAAADLDQAIRTGTRRSCIPPNQP